ncbi:MAG: alpha/beta hydrolase [Spirulina sp. SIO3F2]|nr:alpha/beta hydrolase [Spirulina sp. SIO3F2]
MPLNFINQPPANGKPPQHLLIALHGWGADQQDLTVLAPMLQLGEDYQFVFPNAPFDHPQVPGGRAWYALERSDPEGLETSHQLLRQLVLGLVAETQVPLSQTILLGFSQGGAMTLDVGNQLPLKALCCLSGYPHSPLQITANTPPPVLLVHGRHDPVVPLSEAQRAKQELEALGSAVNYHELAMGHEIPTEAIALTRQFIQGLG